MQGIYLLYTIFLYSQHFQYQSFLTFTALTIPQAQGNMDYQERKQLLCNSQMKLLVS